MPFAAVNGIDIHYRIAGDGPRLLFIGGTGGDLRAHPNVFDYPLAQGFTVLGYDQRGLGQSGKPDAPYDMAMYARDAAGLLDAAGWQRAHVVGFSFGGMVAQELALAQPERIRRLVLLSTTSGGRGGASYPLHELEGLAPEDKVRRMLALADRRLTPAWQAVHPDRFQHMVNQTLERQAVGAGEPGREIGARRQLAARQGHDTYDRLGAIRIPTLVCGGKDDGIAAPEAVRSLARAIPGARLEYFPGGHYFFQEDPESFRLVAEFLEGRV